MSRESEKIFEAVGGASDAQVEEARAGRNKRIRWLAPLAAVIALAVALAVFLSIPGKGGSAYALAEAKYPAEEKGSRLFLPHSSELDHFIRASATRLLCGSGGGNRVCSPLNIYLTLSMLAETAGGESRSQLLALLGAEDMETQRQRAKRLWEQSYYDGENAGFCRLASSLWLRADMDYVKDAVNTLAGDYYASVFRGEMGSGGYNGALQNWLSEQTGGLLKQQAEQVQLDPGTVMALAATIWFKGSWDHKFDPSLTAPQTFHAPAGDVERAFMHGSWEDEIFWGEGFTGVSLRFSNGRRMLFLLPEEGKSPEQLLEDGTFPDFLLSEFRQRPEWEQVTLEVSMPKFDADAALDLLPILRDLGVTDILELEKADFSPLLGPAPAALTYAEHAARVKVDEEGCEAAAYTVVAAAGGAPKEPPRTVEFILDRPFFFAILGMDDLPLFLGIVNDP